jgi:hypothetical protein
MERDDRVKDTAVIAIGARGPLFFQVHNLRRRHLADAGQVALAAHAIAPERHEHCPDKNARQHGSASVLDEGGGAVLTSVHEFPVPFLSVRPRQITIPREVSPMAV